jgi:hypothetical protein
MISISFGTVAGTYFRNESFDVTISPVGVQSPLRYIHV